MRIIAAVAVLAALALVSGVAAGDSKVLDLSEENFDSTIAGHKQVLVEFFAPWCGHCKALAPEYDAASLQLEDKDAGVLAKVDCTVQKELCNRYDVKGFPTVKLFRGPGEPSEYDQARKADAIVKFMVKQAQPAVTELADETAALSFAESDSVKVIALFEAADSVEEAAFNAVANKLRNEYSFAAVKGSGAQAAAAAFKAKVPGVVVRRNFDEGDVVFSGSLDADSIESFIKAQSFPLVGTIGPENYAKYLERGFNFVWVFADLSDDAQASIITDAVTPVAGQYRDKLSFVKLDGVKWAEHGKSLGLTSTTPGVVVEDRETRKRYVFQGETVTKDAFSQFISDYLGGSLKPTIKSEPIPESNDGPVKVVVGKTFDEIVLDDSKDVLVEFYAPWCGHCKALAPKYDELGQLFQDQPNVVIAKVDATANDTPADVQGFPTIILYPAGKKSEPEEYRGGRTVEDMAKFVRSKGTTSGASASASHEDL